MNKLKLVLTNNKDGCQRPPSSTEVLLAPPGVQMAPSGEYNKTVLLIKSLYLDVKVRHSN